MKINGVERIVVDWLGEAEGKINKRLLASAFRVFFLSRGMEASDGMRPIVFGRGRAMRRRKQGKETQPCQIQ